MSAVPARLDCGPDCSARYLDGTTVVLTVVADDHSSFTGWGGACSGAVTTVTVTVDASTSCTATFTPILSGLTIQKAGDGSDAGWVGSFGC